MAQAALRHIVFGLTAAGLLAGCVEGSGPGAGSGGPSATAAPASARSGTGREVEAPEIFQTTDTALWDGRPSLGGIWVASPDATDPERVLMVNLATGKSVTGALFRRERDNPGPTLQMSSDAAEALGMLAGQPTEIKVTALRREEVAAPPEPEPEAEAATTEPADGTKPDTGSDAAATAAAATAALAAAEAGGEGADPATAAEAASPEAGAEAPAPRKTWKERRAEAKAAREAKKAAAAAAAAAAAGAAASDTADTVPTAESAGVAAVETAPLDARDPALALPAADAEPPKTRRQKRAEEAAAAAAAEAPQEEVAPVATGRPIQVASFSQEQNAMRAVEALAKIGVSAQPRKSETNGKVVWGVVATGDAAMLASIKAAGFADAFFLK